MLLTCVFSLSVIASSSLHMSAAQQPEAQPPNFDASMEEDDEMDPSMYDPLDEEEDSNSNIVRREVRRYPDEESEFEIEHRRASVGMPTMDCSCDEVVTKGTLIAIVAALGFLGFFSTTVLLVMAICILRLVDKQRKKVKEGAAVHSSSRRHHHPPPIPPPRPEHTYKPMRPVPMYKRFHPAIQQTTEAAYLSPSELNPGPRIRQERHYQIPNEPRYQIPNEPRYQVPNEPRYQIPNEPRYQIPNEPQRYQIPNEPHYHVPVALQHYQVPVWSQTEPKTTPENEYITVNPQPSLSTPPMESKYGSAEQQPGSIAEGSPVTGMMSRGHENHVYEELE